MDAVILKLAFGLGMHNTIGFFVPIYASVVNTVAMLLVLFFYADKSTQYNKYILSKQANNSRIPPDPKYDFIIVGSGSAGSVVANRLSHHFNVLLLERGGEPNPFTSVPGMQPAMLARPEVDYTYLTVPQNVSCLALINQQSQWSAGFGLGGSSILNSMMHIRGHPLDYDRWAEVTNDERWKYEKLVPYFVRSENFCEKCVNSTEISQQNNELTKYHNTNGELPVNPLPTPPLVSEFIEGLEWGGVPGGDLNAPFYKPTGGVSSYTQKNGRRITSYNAFVEPILDKRPSLQVAKYARVMQVIFEPATNQVIGVKYERFGKHYTVRASKEVILSAGSIATPKILMLSGIGPEEELKSLKIPVRANLPVGRNLQDHVGTLLGPFLIDNPASVIPERDMNEGAVIEFLKNGTGPFSITPVIANTLWTSSRAASAGEGEWPDIQVNLLSTGISDTIIKDQTRAYNLKPDILKEYLDPIKGQDAFSLFVSYGRPRSRGFLTLQSNYYKDPMNINPRYYEDPEQEDISVILDGIQRAVYFAENAPSFKRLGSRLSPIPFPSCKHYTLRSPEYWDCYARQLTLTAHDFTGTAAMAPNNSPYAVVDPELRVLGVKGLRIIDSSVFPYTVTTNINAATIMVAERGSDFVLEAYKS